MNEDVLGSLCRSRTIEEMNWIGETNQPIACFRKIFERNFSFLDNDDDEILHSVIIEGISDRFLHSIGSAHV